jgi:hypothetical protein
MTTIINTPIKAEIITIPFVNNGCHHSAAMAGSLVHKL